MMPLLDYFTSMALTPDTRWVVGGMWAALTVVVLAIIARIAAYRMHSRPTVAQLIYSLSGIIGTSAFVWLLLLGARYEGLPYITARFWLALLGGVALFFLIRSIITYRKTLPLVNESKKRQQAYEQYLPKRSS